MMEKSSRFSSLSGLAAVIAGVTALLGAAFAYFYLLRNPSLTHFSKMQEIFILFADAFVVLIISCTAFLVLSYRKAKNNHEKFWTKTTKRAIYNFAIPMVTGGIFALIYLFRGPFYIVLASTLLFYGLGLINASKYLNEEIHYLGLTEIVMGLLTAYFSKNGILFWAIGFGLCHIVYGLIVYVKYDLKKK